MLKKLTAAGVAAAAVTGALLLAAPANAGIGIGTSGEGGVLSGNQVLVPITAPINVCGNSIAVIGGAIAGCKGGSSVGGGPGYHRPPCHHPHRPPCHRPHRPWSSS
ncbi:chaplin [Actinoallomurus purpureus]|uniref:chaplin family protein n=1 Tax=Actinoallomurus purpureus TaxID=478114 RepID=UPI002093987B|nr:chaplin family protein [Actinoallomurus purpureus]MCO6004302.1 chaplin [Actinoallomurus purpureus]